MLKPTFQNLIGGYSALLADVVRSGVLTYPNVYHENADVHCTRTQANIVYDHIVRKATEMLPSPDFHPIRARQRILFNFRDRFLIQFKKLRENLRFSNYQTRQAELFERVGEIGLPGMSVAIPLITVGYVPKPFLAGIEGIFATFTQNHKPIWVDRLDDAEELPTPILSILPPHDPTPKPARTRIRRSSTGDSATTAG